MTETTACQHCDEPAAEDGRCEGCAWLGEAAVAYALTWPGQTLDSASAFADWYLGEYAEDFQMRRAPDFGPQFRTWSAGHRAPL